MKSGDGRVGQRSPARVDQVERELVADGLAALEVLDAGRSGAARLCSCLSWPNPAWPTLWSMNRCFSGLSQ